MNIEIFLSLLNLVVYNKKKIQTVLLHMSFSTSLDEIIAIFNKKFEYPHLLFLITWNLF